MKEPWVKERQAVPVGQFMVAEPCFHAKRKQLKLAETFRNVGQGRFRFAIADSDNGHIHERETRFK